MRSLPLTPTALAVAALSAATLAGCYTVPPPDETVYPACDGIWVVGQVLPPDYRACSTDTIGKTAIRLVCIDTSKALATHEDMYAYRGETIVAFTPEELEDPYGDTPYAALLGDCYGRSE